MPRRVKFLYFLARFRIVQKFIMLCTVIWILLLLYTAGLMDRLTGEDDQQQHPQPPMSMAPGKMTRPPAPDLSSTMDMIRPEEEPHPVREGEVAVGPVEHTDLELWKKLSFKHWPTLFSYYNITLLGRYISILPTIHLSELVDPKKAIELRDPAEKEGSRFTYLSQQYSEDISHSPGVDNYSHEMGEMLRYPHHFYPKSQREFVITVCLCVLSVIVITYFMTVLYRCMCSRNYSRWRHSWARSGRRRTKAYVKQIKESVPLVLSGHTQSIECLFGDNGLIVSCCLGGQLKIWDSNSGDCVNTITRKSLTPLAQRRPCVGRNIEDSDADLYAEYHGSRSSSETSLVEEGSLAGGDGVRVRRGNSLYQPTPRSRSTRFRRTSHKYHDFKPDLSSTINSEFSTMSPTTPMSSSCDGYDFKSLFEGVYAEHRKLLAEEEGDSGGRVHSSGDLTLMSGHSDLRPRSWSSGEQTGLDLSMQDDDLMMSGTASGDQTSSVWCLSSMHGLVVTGCGSGRIEVWEAETGQLRYHNAISEVGVTGLCVVSNKIVAARLDGTLDFLEMETFQNPVLSPIPVRTQSPPRHYKGHSRSYSADSNSGLKMWDEVIRCAGVTTCRAHQAPINCLQCAGGRIVTASQDHTLKVFRLDNSLCLYTLHGHEGSVTALCLDQVAPLSGVSGSEDGSVRMWDLLTGTCIHKFCWHTGPVAMVTTSPLYIVSVGLDDNMCVWDRTKTSLLHKTDLDQNGVGTAALLSRNLIVTGGQGSISLWDIPRGSLLRKVVFNDSEQRAFVNHVVSIGNNGVVCDQGNELKVVYFPTILEKAE